MRAQHPAATALGIALAALSLACTSARPQAATATVLAGSEHPVDAGEDNRPVLEGTAEGLVVRLGVYGERVELGAVEVLRVPRNPSRRPGEGMIAVRALRGGEEVYATAVPDGRLYALENGGLVEKDERTLIFALPTGAPVTELELYLGDDGAPQRLYLAPRLLEWCREVRQAQWALRWCRAAAEAGGAQ